MAEQQHSTIDSYQIFPGGETRFASNDNQKVGIYSSGEREIVHFGSLRWDIFKGLMTPGFIRDERPLSDLVQYRFKVSIGEGAKLQTYLSDTQKGRHNRQWLEVESGDQSKGVPLSPDDKQLLETVRVVIEPGIWSELAES